MESWRRVWREGFAPQFSRKHLEALRQALLIDDARLLQGATTSPPPLQYVQDWPVEAADPIVFGAWQAEGKETVSEAETFFAQACYECDRRMGKPAECRWFLNWWDDSPRSEIRRELLVEINLELAKRSSNKHPMVMALGKAIAKNDLAAADALHDWMEEHP